MFTLMSAQPTIY